MYIVFRRGSSARARRYLPALRVGMGIEDRRLGLPAKPCAAAIRRCAVVVFPGFSGGVGVISNPRAPERRRPWGLGAGARRGEADATTQQKGDTEQSVAGRVHCSRLSLFVGFQHHCEGGYVYWDRSADILVPHCVTETNVRADIECHRAPWSSSWEPSASGDCTMNSSR